MYILCILLYSYNVIQCLCIHLKSRVYYPSIFSFLIAKLQPMAADFEQEAGLQIYISIISILTVNNSFILRVILF